MTSKKRIVYSIVAVTFCLVQCFVALMLIDADGQVKANEGQRWLMQATSPPVNVVFRTPTSAPNPFKARLPFDGKPRLTSYFDHNTPNYTRNGVVVIYTGDSSTDCDPYCYDGHSGVDYGMVVGTKLFAAADGVIVKTEQRTTSYGVHVVINHQNGYHTLYAHMSEIAVKVGQAVKMGDYIGLSGNTGNSTGPHLHFGVYRTANSVIVPNEIFAADPFGWRDTINKDPMLNYPTTDKGVLSSCVWRSLDTDHYHCGDILVEDSGRRAAVFTGNWRESTYGLDGSHYVLNTQNSNSAPHADWKVLLREAGLYQIDVFIPSRNATTRQAKYQIYRGNNVWQSVTVDQLPKSDEWVTLGNYEMPVGEAHVWLSANTNEPTGTTKVGADAVRFRRLSAPASPKPTIAPTPTGVNRPTSTPTPSPTITPTPALPVTPLPLSRRVFLPNLWLDSEWE